jgi:hypothetical protein
MNALPCYAYAAWKESERPRPARSRPALARLRGRAAEPYRSRAAGHGGAR